jgi:hypothetical protein
MRAEANRTAVRDAFEARQAGTGPITEVFADDMVWRIEGHSLARRRHCLRLSYQRPVDEGHADRGRA